MLMAFDIRPKASNFFNPLTYRHPNNLTSIVEFSLRKMAFPELCCNDKKTI